jgi:mRNA-degrading endonuclease toxin of MazEF toxin-antitoxin module
VGELARGNGAKLKRGEVWWADLGSYRPREQTGRRPVVIWQSDTLTQALESVLVVPLTTNLGRAKLAGTAMISSTSLGGPPEDSVALAFQMRAIPKSALKTKIRDLDQPPFVEHFCWISLSGPCPVRIRTWKEKA